jgi:prolyl-tRNA synthetase
VIVTPVNYKDEMKAAADQLYDELRAAKVEVLLDDRAERPGVKFKDADLVGIPYRIVIGAEKLKKGQVELFTRATRKTDLVDRATVVTHLRRLTTLTPCQ